MTRESRGRQLLSDDFGAFREVCRPQSSAVFYLLFSVLASVRVLNLQDVVLMSVVGLYPYFL